MDADARQVLTQWMTVNGDAHWDRLRLAMAGLLAENERLAQQAEYIRQELDAKEAAIENFKRALHLSDLKRKDAEAQVARLTAENAAQQVQLTARRVHQARLGEAAHKLYQRFGKDDPEVMDVWSLAVIDPEPPTVEEIAWAHAHFPAALRPPGEEPR